MFPLTEAWGRGSAGMSKDGIRGWEDLAAEDGVAGCPGYVSQNFPYIRFSSGSIS